MSTRNDPTRHPLLPGTLDLLILRVLLFGPQHGHGIVVAIEQQSHETLLVDHGSLYPALQRLEGCKWIAAKWGVSSNNRRARFYQLTAAGHRQLHHEVARWRGTVIAIGHVLGPDLADE